MLSWPSLTRLLILIIALIVYGSFYPWRFDVSRVSGNPFTTLAHSWDFRFNRVIVRDVFINVLLYVPLGAVARLSMLKTHPALVQIACPLVLGFVLSSAIEMLQLYAMRRCSMTDVIANTLGTLAGVMLAGPLHTQIKRRASSWELRRGDAAALAVLVCWLVYMLFPFFPVLGRTALRHKFRVFAESSLVEPITFASSACGLFIVASLAHTAGIRTKWTVPVMAAIAGPAQFFLAKAQPLPSSWLGIAVGWLVFMAVPERLRRAATISAIAVATAVRGLAPFRVASTPNPFNWVPFGPVLHGHWFSATGVLFEKVFFYAALMWALRATGASLRSTTLVATIALATIEALQVYLPGRTPEITDPLLSVLIAYVARTGKRKVGCREQPDV